MKKLRGHGRRNTEPFSAAGPGGHGSLRKEPPVQDSSEEFLGQGTLDAFGQQIVTMGNRNGNMALTIGNNKRHNKRH